MGGGGWQRLWLQYHIKYCITLCLWIHYITSQCITLHYNALHWVQRGGGAWADRDFDWWSAGGAACRGNSLHHCIASAFNVKSQILNVWIFNSKFPSPAKPQDRQATFNFQFPIPHSSKWCTLYLSDNKTSPQLCFVLLSCLTHLQWFWFSAKAYLLWQLSFDNS